MWQAVRGAYFWSRRGGEFQWGWVMGATVIGCHGDEDDFFARFRLF